MVVPDFELICEIMLVAEGFLEARLLARKFITLYSLCKELLSKQVTWQKIMGGGRGGGERYQCLNHLLITLSSHHNYVVKYFILCAL
jgi:hypothetical protein